MFDLNSLNAKVAIIWKPVWKQLTALYTMATSAFNELTFLTLIENLCERLGTHIALNHCRNVFEYGVFLICIFKYSNCKSPSSVRIRENTDQKTP